MFIVPHEGQQPSLEEVEDTREQLSDMDWKLHDLVISWLPSCLKFLPNPTNKQGASLVGGFGDGRDDRIHRVDKRVGVVDGEKRIRWVDNSLGRAQPGQLIFHRSGQQPHLNGTGIVGIRGRFAVNRF